MKGKTMRKIIARRGRDGFSLIETIIAISILLTGFLGITGLILSTIANNNYNRNLAMADNISTNLMEFWQSAAYQKVETFLATGDGTTHIYSTDSTPSYTDLQLTNALTSWRAEVSGSLPGGRGVVTVTKNTAISSIDAADIKVEVQWVQKGNVHNSKKDLYRNKI